jgi:hypothetical protein
VADVLPDQDMMHVGRIQALPLSSLTGITRNKIEFAATLCHIELLGK